jgi:DNA-binding IclR family transcriptional regulator
MSDNVGTVAAVERALQILEAFRPKDRYLTLAEIARRTKIAKPTLLRLAQSLLDHDLLARHEDGRYYIGVAAIGLATLHMGVERNERAITSVLDKLVEVTGETASYSIRRNQFRVYIYYRNSSHRLRDHIRFGETVPIDRGAPGRIFSAFGEPADPKLLNVRKQMYTISKGEVEPGMVGISCPVLNAHNQIDGAVSLSGPESRMLETDIKRYVTCVLEAAKEITQNLGGPYPSFDAALANVTRRSRVTVT